MGVLIMVGQLVLSLSILIVLHEMGHFFPARIFGVRVEKFYLFFDPWFSLFKTQKGETEYGVGWLPLGGYVKLSGMVDESFDTEQLKSEPQEYEFRSKPAWQRLIIMLGGVTVNFILGFAIFGMVLWVWGEEYFPSENIKYGVFPDSLGYELGIRDGDHVVAIDDQPLYKFNNREVIRQIVINNASQLTVKRGGDLINLPISEDYPGILAGQQGKAFLYGARIPFVAASVQKGMPADQAGIKPEDRIIAVNGQPTTFFHEFRDAIQDLKGKEVELTVLRDKSDTLRLPLTLTEKGLIGVERYSELYFFDTKREEFTLAQAIPAGVVKGWQLLGDQVKAFGQMFRNKINPSDTMGGFGTIAKMYGDEWIWERFWRMTAILSLILAFMNLLPIPALDGGHVMFLLYEVVSGRKPSDKFMEIATLAGFILVIGLVLYVNGLDVMRWIKNAF